MAIEVLTAIAKKIGEYLVAPIGCQFSYLLCYNYNIKNFRRKIEDLGRIRVEVQTRVNDAEKRGIAIPPDVGMSLTSVNEIKEKWSKFFDEELQSEPISGFKRKFNSLLHTCGLLVNKVE
ncbi:hypothetical protein L1049_021530 [Liquidambar formosana]|uniref:Uncharacterized protein n=1 Tax=Liquidambar formosana TaxID=63359 RepID=A0AAP0QZM9_LIQFO